MFERLWIAVCALLLIQAALLAAWVWYTLRRTNYTLGQSFWFSLNHLFTTLLWRIKISGRLPVGPRQGAVIVSNHSSGIDPLSFNGPATGLCIGWWRVSIGNIR